MIDFDTALALILNEARALPSEMVALDAAAATIQDALGQTDGGFASFYFAADAGDAIRRILKGYIAAERAHLAGGA